MIGCFVASFLLRDQPLYLVLFVGQLALYSAAVAGLCFPKVAERLSIVRLSAFFVLVNLAALKALTLWVLGTRIEVWQPTQRPG